MNVVPYAAAAMAPAIVTRAVGRAIQAGLPLASAIYANRNRIRSVAGGINKRIANRKTYKKNSSSSKRQSMEIDQPYDSGQFKRQLAARRIVRHAGKRKYKKTKRTSFVRQKDSSNKRTGTTGHKKYKKKRRSKKKTSKGKKSVSERLENRGTVTATDCAYIGHGTPLHKIWALLWLSIVKDLFTQQGTDMLDPTKIIPGFNGYFVTVALFRDQSSTAVTSFSAATTVGTTTFQALADALSVAYSAKIVADAGVLYRKPIIDRISLDQYTDPALTNQSINRAIIYAARYKFHVDFQSVLKFLNATPAVAISVSDVTNDDTGDIHAVPLVGYKYECRTATIQPRVRQDSYASWTALSLNPNLGHFGISQADLGNGGASTLTNYFKKPPTNDIFANCGKRIPVQMAPGEILDDKCTWSKCWTLQKWVQMYHDQAIDVTVNVGNTFGRMNLIALEHKLFYTGDANILLNYQQDISMFCYTKHTNIRPSVSFVQVN